VARVKSGPMLHLVTEPTGPATTACDVIDEVVALLDDRLPQVSHADRFLGELWDLREILAAGQSIRRRHQTRL
jgi:hypothetical protein